MDWQQKCNSVRGFMKGMRHQEKRKSGGNCELKHKNARQGERRRHPALDGFYVNMVVYCSFIVNDLVCCCVVNKLFHQTEM